MRLFVSSVIAVLSLLIGTAKAESDSLDDSMGPREIAVGEAMRGGATGASSIGLNPAGLPLNRELVFEGGYGYRASDSASLIGVSACDSTNVVPGCFFYQYAGASIDDVGGMALDHTTHVVGSSLSRMITPRVMVGATTKYFRLHEKMAGSASVKASGFSFDFGATVRLTEMINLGLAGQNLLATTEDDWFPRTVGGVLARPFQTLALSFDSRWKTDGSGARYGGGGELFIRAGDYGIPLRVGGLADTGLDSTYVTGGIGLANIRWTVDIAARRAVSGVDETLILASMRFFGPRQAGPSLENL